MQLFRKLFLKLSSWIRGKIQLFLENPMQNASLCCSYLVIAVSAVVFVVALVIYSVHGGFQEQWRAIETDIWHSFTWGTVSVFYKPVVVIPIVCLMALGFIFMMIDFYLSATVVRKVFGTIALSLIALSTAFICITEFSPWVYNWLVIIFEKILPGHSLEDLFSVLLIVLLIVLIVMSVLLIILLPEKSLLWHIVVAGVVAFAGVPLLVALIENILSLIVIALLIGIVLIFFLPSLFSGNSSSVETDNSYHQPDSIPDVQNARMNTESQRSSAAKKEKSEESDPKIIKVNPGDRLYLDEGEGFFAPMTTCIFIDTLFDSHKYLCTLQDLRDGKVEIWQNGSMRKF